MTENRNRCVITGLGMVSAIGNSVAECWEAALAGQCGIGKVASVDSTGCYADLGAEVHADDLDNVTGAADMDRVSKLCVKASREAVADAGISFENDAARCGVIMGSCVGGAVSIDHFYRNGCPAEDVRKMTISPIANQVAGQFGIGGIVTNVANACAAGTISIAYACDLIRAGKGDAFIVGGADAFASVPYAGFLSLHALDAEPCSPFNRSSGITLGEGAGALVVESYEHAVARGARIYCEVLGSGIGSDAYHITAPRPDGEGQMNAIRRAIRTSGLEPSDIDYINAHGTGTAKNDEAEFLSLRTIFDGEHTNLRVSSTKAMVGHCLGAAGAIEAVFSVKAVTDGKIPPTIGYTEEDLTVLAERAGNIDFMPNMPKAAELTSVMSNSFAFGGNNASIIFSKKSGNVTAPVKKAKVVVTGMGIVSPVGQGKEKYLAAVREGKAPETNSVFAGVGAGDYARCGLKMAFYRKLDKFSQLQAVSGMDALADAGLTVTEENATDIGIIVGTEDGPVATVCDFAKDLVEKGNSAGSAFRFPNTVYNAAGGYLSICSGIKGYNVTVTNGAQAGLGSIAYAVNIIRDGVENAMLATGTDENCETIGCLYERMSILAPAGNRPYVGSGAGMVLSEGSTTLVLENAETAKARGSRAYAEVIGYGMTHAARSRAVGDEAVSALVRAVREAAVDAGIGVENIDTVIGFGNGRADLETTEIAAYRALFGQRDVPVCNVRGVIGEGRAATAALSAAHAALLLSGELSGEVEAYTLNGVPRTVEIRGENCRTVLVTAAAEDGSFTALLFRKI